MCVEHCDPRQEYRVLQQPRWRVRRLRVALRAVEEPDGVDCCAKDLLGWEGGEVADVGGAGAEEELRCFVELELHELRGVGRADP